MPADSSPNQGVHEEEDQFETARGVVKNLRSLCLIHGAGFKPPDAKFLSNRKNDGSSSESSLAEEKEEEDSYKPANWQDLKVLLRNLHADRPSFIRNLTEFSQSLNELSEKARLEIEELNAREEASSNDSDSETPDTSDCEALIALQPEDTPGVQALKRCAALIPPLRQRAAARARLMAPQIRPPDGTAKNIEVGSVSASDEEMTEVDKKLAALGDLPPNADPELAATLTIQREEIRNIIQRIESCEKQVAIHKVANDYIDGSLSPGGIDQETLNAGLCMAQEARQQIFAEKHDEADKEYKRGKEQSMVPKEEEEEKLRQDCQRLELECKEAEKRIAKLDEFSDLICSPSASEQRSAPPLPVNLKEAPEKLLKLKRHADDLANQTQQHQKKGAALTSLLRNAEDTVKILEETKTVFLEQVAHKCPSAFAQLSDIIGQTADESSWSSGESDSDTADEETVAQMEAEELQQTPLLRKALVEAECTLTSKKTTNTKESVPIEKEALDSVKALARRLRDMNTGRGKEDAYEHSSDADDDAHQSSCGNADDQEQLTPEQAATRLRAMRHTDLSNLLVAQAKNDSIRTKAESARRELQALSKSVMEANPRTDLSEDHIAQIARKQRELAALRKRWWSERQDLSSTVRRSLAVAGLHELTSEDVPPESGTLFDRIHASMSRI